MKKILNVTIIAGIIVASISIGYYFFIFQPQLAVNSCLVRARNDFETSKTNTCKQLIQINQTLYNRCIDNTKDPGKCIILNSDVFSPSLSCNIPKNLMDSLQQDYNKAIRQCNNLSIIKLQ